MDANLKLLKEKKTLKTILRKKKKELDLEKQKNLELEKIISEKNKFFSVIAHDLRSALGALISVSQLVVEEGDSMKIPEIIDWVKLIERDAVNTQYLLEDLLEWSKIGMSKTPELFSLSLAIIEDIEVLKVLSNKKKIDIDLDVVPEFNVCTHRLMFKSIVSNLVSNAIKFTHKGGTITISAVLSIDKMIISIKDNGIGMSEKMAKTLFDSNFKNGRVGTEGESSTGLGLSICKEFVELSGGKIWVHSKEGKGSEFYFTLPICTQG